MVNKFKNNISTLVLSVFNEKKSFPHDIRNKFIFRNILKIFPNLVYLKFVQLSARDIAYLSFANEIPMFSSSVLRELHINVSSLTECLYLLDGRLNQLEIFHADIEIIHHIAPNIDMKVSQSFFIQLIESFSLYYRKN